MSKGEFKMEAGEQPQHVTEESNCEHLRRSVNGFEKAVKRMKGPWEEKEALHKKLDGAARGAGYEKLRALESRPPSFITSPRPRKKSRQPYYDLA